jgi:bacterioferritin
MRHSSIHPRTLGYLGRALSLEYSAVQQYMTQAALCEAWGLHEAAARFREETVEEMQHANRIVSRMLGLGVSPNGTQLRPAALAHDLTDLLLQDAALEADIVALYAEASQFCERIRDPENAEFFRALWREEAHHAEEIDTWLASLGRPQRGDDNDRAFF